MDWLSRGWNQAVAPHPGLASKVPPGGTPPEQGHAGLSIGTGDLDSPAAPSKVRWCTVVIVQKEVRGRKHPTLVARATFEMFSVGHPAVEGGLHTFLCGQVPAQPPANGTGFPGSLGLWLPPWGLLEKS